MTDSSQFLSVVIPTYRREEVLLRTLGSLLALEPPAGEILVVDQTEAHQPETERELLQLESAGKIRRISPTSPSIPQAMNMGLLEARGEVVLFLDDDIVPNRALVEGHRRAYAEHPEAWAVVGQVIQPEDGARRTEVGGRRSEDRSPLRRDLDFKFNGPEGAWIENAMAGNLSVKREKALALGGFDANFIPPVSFRFESEFAKRLIASGGKIWFEPRASIRHLRVGSGGTRAHGHHLASASPLHSVGAYYYMLRQSRGWERIQHMLKRPFREVRTKFHLMHPWYIPVKFIGELRAIRLAVQLYKAGPKLITREEGGGP